jgi:UDP-N-acetylglucosamine--N-acetylmuramyl-(pentapeptide) pyrophosphoryl-undecaprenol N-acetylglucosamine transferase
MRVIVAAGGTGGHLFPGLSLAREFERQVPGSEVIFVGTTQGIEARVVPREGFELVLIKAQGVMGKGVTGALRGLAMLPVGLLGCLAVCRSRRPDLVFGIGGYTSPPLILAAFLLGIKRAILEPNAHPGVANRALSPIANLVFVSFPDTVAFFGADKTRVVGTPIRREFYEGPGDLSPEGGLHKPTLLVFGGSQGARSINKAMVAALPALIAAYPGLHVIHQTGERDFEDIVAAYRTYWPTRRIEAEVVPFLYDMPRAFRQADLIVSRSGATTVAELTACGKPAILIPFPHAIYGHQERNARVLERAGAARVILDDGLTGDALAHTIQSLLADPARLAEMRRNSKALGRADSAEQVVAACRELVQDVKRST